MRHVFLILFSIFSSISAVANSKNTSLIDSSQITFKYISSAGDFSFPCKHWITDPELNDWDVLCGKNTATPKQFKVHLIIRQRPRLDNSSALEILYWVIDRNKPKPEFSSHSQTINFKDAVSISDLTLFQSVENDYAQLELTYRR